MELTDFASSFFPIATPSSSDSSRLFKAVGHDLCDLVIYTAVNPAGDDVDQIAI